MRYTVTPQANWRKSSYSGSGDGNACVEIFDSPARIAVRDSKDPSAGILTFTPEAFSPFIETVKGERPR
ncbi:DUF397 domain-containing protein [Streptomyces sp. NPDC015414]|uniref:DUF397 domain-containing protein n=1 Tax=Streptomyces sp. NPDC015414 TaxID=3364957 RepID=UPI0036FBDDCC